MKPTRSLYTTTDKLSRHAEEYVWVSLGNAMKAKQRGMHTLCLALMRLCVVFFFCSGVALLSSHFPHNLHSLHTTTDKPQAAIEASIHSALPHGRWQLRCGGHHRCSGAVLGGNTTKRRILSLKTWNTRFVDHWHPSNLKDGHTYPRGLQWHDGSTALPRHAVCRYLKVVVGSS